MTKVTNNHTSPLVVADVTVRPKTTVEVDDTAFEQWSQGQTAKMWLDQDLVAVEGKRAKVTPPPTGERRATGDADTGTSADETGTSPNAQEERAALLDEARTLGLNPNGNISTDKLREQVIAKRDKA